MASSKDRQRKRNEQQPEPDDMPETTGVRGLPAEHGADAGDEDYSEFLQTQHFFNDTSTYSSQDIQSSLEFQADQEENDYSQPAVFDDLASEVTPLLLTDAVDDEESAELLAVTRLVDMPERTPSSAVTPATPPIFSQDASGSSTAASKPGDSVDMQGNATILTARRHDISGGASGASTQGGGTADQEQTDWKIGDIIDSRYEVKSIIGRGGMGVVYRVHHREWDLDLAVKMPLLRLVADQAAKARFVREAQTWIALGLHPNIVQCWYVREFGGIPRVFMDYVTGGSLKDWIVRKRIVPGNWAQILDMGIQACDGLGYAHERGLTAHRDVKPGNLLLTDDGELRVTDFGIAKRAEYAEVEDHQFDVAADGRHHTVTVTGADVGTPEYGAPEQWGEAKHADHRADIYALGGVLFELCCGRRAFDDGRHNEQPHAIIGRHLFSPAPDPRSINPEIPANLAEVLTRCLSKQPEDRPESMRALREALSTLYHDIVGTAYLRDVPKTTELRSSSLNNRAVSLLDLGDVNGAFQTLEKALKRDPHHAESVYNKALLEWREERIADDEVVRRLREAARVNSMAGAYLGMVHLERGAIEDAEAALTEALQTPQAAQVSGNWRALGDALMAREKYDQAVPAYQHALSLLPGDSELEYRLTLARQEDRAPESRRLFPYPHCLRVLTGGNQRIERLMLTPDASYALAAGEDSVRLWNLTAGKFLWTYSWSDVGHGVWTCKGYAGSRTCAAITPDSHFALSGCADETVIRLWDLHTGHCLNTLSGHQAEVLALALLPDGERVLSGSADGTVRLWTIATGECVRTFEGWSDAVTALAVTPDGQYALCGSGPVIRQFELERGKVVRTFRGHGDAVTALAIAPEQQQVLSASRDKTVRLWTLTSGRCLHVLTGHTEGVTDLTISPDESVALSAGLDKDLRLWNLTTAACDAVLQGHASHITGVRITPDGRFAFSVSRDRTLRLWRLATGRCLRSIPEFTHWLEVLALTPDGQCALFGNSEELRLKHLPSQTYQQTFRRASGPVQWQADTRQPTASDREGEPETVALHNLPPGENFLAIMGRDEGQTFTVVTPSGDLGVSVGPSETLYAWHVEADHKHRVWGMRGLDGLSEFKSHRTIMRAFVTTADGKLAVTGDEDGKARLWELPSAHCLRIFDGHRASLQAVAITPQAERILTGSTDGTMRLWERESGACVNVFIGHNDAVTALAMTADGRFGFSGSNDRTLRLWDLGSGKCLRTFSAHNTGITAVAMTPDGRYGLSACKNRSWRLWRLDADIPRQPAAFQVCRHVGHQELEVFQQRFERLLTRADEARQAGNIATAYTFLTLARSIPGYERDPDALAMNAALSDFLEKKRLRGGHLLHALPGHTKTIMTVAATTDGRFILSGGQDDSLRLWGLGPGQPIRTFTGHRDSVTCAAVTPDRHLAISGSHDKTLRLWAIATGECLKVLTGHTEYVTSLSISADGRFAASGSRDATVRLWSLTAAPPYEVFDGLQIPAEDAYAAIERASERSVRVLKGASEPVEAVAISAEGRFLISGGQDMVLRLWQLATGRCIRVFRGHSGYITAIALSRSGKFVISASRDGTVRLWRVSTGMCLRILRGHEGYVSAVGLSADGRFAVSGSWDRTLRLWNLKTGECVQVFERHEDEIEAVTMTADGHFAISGGRDAMLRIWEFDWELSPKKTPVS